MNNLDQLYAEIIETAIRAVCTGYTHQMVLDRFPFLPKEEALQVHDMLARTRVAYDRDVSGVLEVTAWVTG